MVNSDVQKLVAKAQLIPKPPSRAEKGRLGKPRQAGTEIYEVTVTVDYTKENENGEN